MIIVNWNSGDLLRKCLEALDSQTHVPEQIIVVDNNSSDHSFACASDRRNVRLLRMQENLGFAAANNLAFEQCETAWVVLLNPDAFPEPEWLQALVKAAEEHPEMVAFGSRQLCHVQPERLDGTGDLYHISGLVKRRDFGRSQNMGEATAGEIFSPCAAAAMYRLDAVQFVGGFDEDFFCYLEDVDLGFRLRLAGYRAIYVPNAVVTHVGSALTGDRHSDFSVYHGQRNLIWTFVKNMPAVLFWLLLPLHVAVNFGNMLRFTIKGRAGAVCRAKWDAIKGIRSVWSKRQQIQSKRRVKISDLWKVMDKGFL